MSTSSFDVNVALQNLVQGVAGTGQFSHLRGHCSGCAPKQNGDLEQLRQIASYLNQLGEETKSKTRSLESIYGSGPGCQGGYPGVAGMSVNGGGTCGGCPNCGASSSSSSETSYRSSTVYASSSRGGGSSADAMNEAAMRKWRSPKVQSSMLLSGPSHLDHVPGSQYCIDAGLHHHHHVSRQPPAPKTPTRRSPPFDCTWHNNLVTCLQQTGKMVDAVASRMGSVCECCEARARETYVLKYEELMRKLDEIHRSGLNAQCRTCDDLRSRFEKERSAWNDERARLMRRIEEMMNVRPPVPAADHSECIRLRNELADENNRLRRENEDKDRRIRELEALLKDKSGKINIQVVQTKPHAHLPQHPGVKPGNSLWASGVVNKEYLGRVNTVPEVKVTRPEVKVMGEDGMVYDTSKVNVKVEEKDKSYSSSGRPTSAGAYSDGGYDRS